MTIEETGVSRRTLVKGAAWSLPVIAVAAATPLAAASTAENFDVAVTPSCVGNYDLTGLLGLIEAVPGVGDAAGATVQGLLSAIGLEPFQSRGYTITAAEGTIPAGTQFTLTTEPGLIDLSLLAGAINASVLGVVSVNGSSSATLELAADLPEGTSTTIQLGSAAVDLGLTGSTSLALVGSDNPSTAPGASNSAELNLVSVTTNLGSLVNLGALGILLNALSITVQLCPGQSLPTP